MKRSRGITVYGSALIVLGMYNLISIGNYKQFCFMFRPLIPALIAAVYLFTILYSICSVYCGARILKLEDWARKTIVGLTSLSVLLGLFLNRIVMVNFKEFLLLDKSGITPDMIGPVYNYAVVIVALVTIFELSVIYYFTRRAVVSQFRWQ